jgi:hypothetical protein
MHAKSIVLAAFNRKYLRPIAIQTLSLILNNNPARPASAPAIGFVR